MVIAGALIVVITLSLQDRGVDDFALFTIVLGAWVVVIERQGRAHNALASQACVPDGAVISAVVAWQAIRCGRMATGNIPFVIAGAYILGTDIIVKAAKGSASAYHSNFRAVPVFCRTGLAKVFLGTAIPIITGCAFF